LAGRSKPKLFDSVVGGPNHR